MKLKIAVLIMGLFLVSCRASAQIPTYTTPQTDVEPASFNGTTPAPGTTFCAKNLGQTVHFFTYTTTTSGNVLSLDIVLRGTNDGVNFFDISEHASGLISGAVYAVGSYAKVCVVVQDFQTSGGSTLSGTYAGTSATSGPLLGIYSGAQTYIKTIFTEVSAGASQTLTLVPPAGSTSGYLVLFEPNGGTLPAGSSLQVGAISGNTTQNLLTGNLATPAGTQFVAVPDARSQQIVVSYTSGGTSTTNLSLYYIFVPPGAQSGITAGETQPLSWASSQLNTQTVSGTNAAVTVSISAKTSSRVHLFSVSARCSAGTSSVTVKDGVGGTVIWSTGAAEVATTTFKYQWNPALATTVGNGMDIVLAACGSGNTGTVDVQASQF